MREEHTEMSFEGTIGEGEVSGRRKEGSLSLGLGSPAGHKGGGTRGLYEHVRATSGAASPIMVSSSQLASSRSNPTHLTWYDESVRVGVRASHGGI